MKKILALVLAIVLTLAFVGCETNSTTSDESVAPSTADSSLSVESTIENPNEVLNTILKDTKFITLSHFGVVNGKDFTLKEEDKSLILGILSDLEVTNVREYDKEADGYGRFDFKLLFSSAENSSPFTQMAFEEQVVCLVNGVKYVLETSNFTDIINRLIPEIERIVVENCLKIDYQNKNPREVLNEIIKNTKTIGFSHYEAGKVLDWFFKETDVSAILGILSDLEITSMRLCDENIGNQYVGDFAFYLPDTKEEDHSPPAEIYLGGQQALLFLDDIAFVIETQNADDIVSRLTPEIDKMVYENFLKIDGEIESSNEVLNDILNRTQTIVCIHEAGTDSTVTKEESLVILKIFSEIEITNLTPFSGDIKSNSEQPVYYFYDTTEKDAPFFAQMNFYSRRILFSDGTGYEFEYPYEIDLYNLGRRIFHEFNRAVFGRRNRDE